MKLLYTQGTLSEAGHMIVMRAIGLNNTALTAEDADFNRRFPEVKNIIDKVFDTAKTMKEFDEAKLGDIIWVETSGGKVIANCIVFDQNDDLNYAAAKRAFEAVNARATKVGQDVISTNLFAGVPIGRESKSYAHMRWQNIKNMLELIFEDKQVVIFIPDDQDLVEILDTLGGYRKIYDMPIIRFRRTSDDSDK